MLSLFCYNYYKFCHHDADFLFGEDAYIGLISIHFFVSILNILVLIYDWFDVIRLSLWEAAPSLKLQMKCHNHKNAIFFVCVLHADGSHQ